MRARDHWIELDFRHGHGLEVALFWRPADGATAVAVHDAGAGESFVRTVPAHCAGDAFRHPFAYHETSRARKPAQLRPARVRDASTARPPDVDELWVTELADEVVASFERLLDLGAGDQESS